MLTDKIIEILSKEDFLLTDDQQANEIFLKIRFLLEKWYLDYPPDKVVEIGEARGWTEDVLEEEMTARKVNLLQRALISHLKSGRSPTTQATAVWALGALPNRKLVPLLKELLRRALKMNDTNLLYQSLVALNDSGEKIFKKDASHGIDEELRNESLARNFLSSS